MTCFQVMLFFFFKQKTAYELRISDWSSDVCSSDLLVAADRLRFDFSHPKALSADEIAAIEADVNAHIRSNDPVGTRLMTPDEAIAAGAMALFGEKYGEDRKSVV